MLENLSRSRPKINIISFMLNPINPNKNFFTTNQRIQKVDPYSVTDICFYPKPGSTYATPKKITSNI